MDTSAMCVLHILPHTRSKKTSIGARTPSGYFNGKRPFRDRLHWHGLASRDMSNGIGPSKRWYVVIFSETTS